MKRGILSYDLAKDLSHQDISMREVQDKRNLIEVIPGSTRLHQYANLYFDARNPMMYLRREKRGELCVLHVSYEVVNIPNTAIADRNASSQYARFLKPSSALDMLDYELIFAPNWTDNDSQAYWVKKSHKCAEVLVLGQVDSRYIQGASVCNETACEALRNTGFPLPIHVDPNMFFC